MCIKNLIQKYILFLLYYYIIMQIYYTIMQNHYIISITLNFLRSVFEFAQESLKSVVKSLIADSFRSGDKETREKSPW